MAGSLVISTLNNDTGVLATQNGMSGIAKAWAIVDTNLGNLNVLSSFNISSVVRTQTGWFSFNLITPMASSSWVANFNSWQSQSILDLAYNIVGGTASQIDVRVYEGGVQSNPVSLFFVLHGN